MVLNKYQMKTLVEIVTTQLGVKEKDIIPQATFDELGADLLDKIALIMVVEDEFKKCPKCGGIAWCLHYSQISGFVCSCCLLKEIDEFEEKSKKAKANIK